jgi:hypothetical protein
MSAGRCPGAMAAEGDTVLLFALKEVALRVLAVRSVLAAGDAAVGRGEAEALMARGRAAWARIGRLTWR